MNNLNQEELKEIESLSAYLKVIADPSRLRILTLLSYDCKCVCEIGESLNLPQNLVSHHLSKLKDIGLLREHKRGYFSVHHLNRDILKDYEVKLRVLLKQKPKTRAESNIKRDCFSK